MKHGPAINPNHPVTQVMDDQWHKLCALALHILGRDTVVITATDLEALNARFPDGGPIIVVHSHADCIELRLISAAEGARLAAKHGGLPI